MRFVFFFFPPHTDKLPTLLNKSEFHEHSEGFVCLCTRISVSLLNRSQLFWKLTLWSSEHPISNVWREGVSHHQEVFWTPTGCPTVQLNSNTIYLETASDSIGYVLSPTRPHGPPLPPTSLQTNTHTHTHTSDVNRKSRLSPVLLTD